VKYSDGSLKDLPLCYSACETVEGNGAIIIRASPVAYDWSCFVNRAIVRYGDLMLKHGSANATVVWLLSSLETRVILLGLAFTVRRSTLLQKGGPKSRYGTICQSNWALASFSRYTRRCGLLAELGSLDQEI